MFNYYAHVSQKKECSKWVKIVSKNKKSWILRVTLFVLGSRAVPTSGAAAALLRCPFADAALGTLGTAHRAAGAAAWGGKEIERSEQTRPENSLPQQRPVSIPPAPEDP